MDRLRIATFNVESLGGRGRGQAPLAARVEALAPMLEQLDADVLCLQEVHAERRHRRGPREMRALDTVLASTRYHGFHRAFTPGKSGGGADVHNLVVLSRYPIVDQRVICHELVPPVRYAPVTAPDRGRRSQGDLRWDRPLLLAVVDLGPRRLHVVSLHLRAPIATPIPAQKLSPHRWRTVGGWAEGLFLAGLKRTGQALEARLVIEGVFEAEGDQAWIAVAGDLNADLEETPLRTLLADPTETGNPALAARALYATETSLPREARFSVIHQGTRRLLDHVLVSRALARGHVRTEIHNGQLVDEYDAFIAGTPTPGSFHAPVLAEFDLARVAGARRDLDALLAVDRR